MQSLFAFLEDIHDDLIFDLNLEFNENTIEIPQVLDNSILKAYHILKENFSLKIPKVILKKKIPIQAGLGGGSSDCACFVNTVFDIWNFSQQEKLNCINMFRSLGSDAKVFLFKYFTNSKFVYINGTGLDGEMFSINFENYPRYILIINNGTRLSTKEVFANFRNSLRKELSPPNKFPQVFYNSLEKTSLALEPSLRKVLTDIELTSPIFSGISGSGSSCFGMYHDIPDIDDLKSKYIFVKLSKI